MVIGGIFTFGATYFIAPSENNSISKATSDEKKPIYWVAPMDANYKRDKPGKSPMGMDLVPVFDDDGKGPDEGPGTIRGSLSRPSEREGVRGAGPGLKRGWRRRRRRRRRWWSLCRHKHRLWPKLRLLGAVVWRELRPPLQSTTR